MIANFWIGFNNSIARFIDAKTRGSRSGFCMLPLTSTTKTVLFAEGPSPMNGLRPPDATISDPRLVPDEPAEDFVLEGGFG